MISLIIFDLQRRTIPQIKALDISLWPYVIIFSARIHICKSIKSRIWALFFPQTLVKPNHLIFEELLVKLLKKRNKCDFRCIRNFRVAYAVHSRYFFRLPPIHLWNAWNAWDSSNEIGFAFFLRKSTKGGKILFLSSHFTLFCHL